MLQICDLVKRYGKHLALNKINLQIKAGEKVALMGPSGSGKSTLIRCINRLTEPNSGAIFLHGQNLLQLSPADLCAVRREIGFVFQHFHLIRRLTVGENVQLGLMMAGMTEEMAKKRATEALTKVGMAEYFFSPVLRLSGGQQQRVGIARALAAHPSLLLMDEPTAALDPILVREVLEVIETLGETEQTTMVIVTHEIFFALRFADRIILLDHGEIVEEGNRETIFQHPVSSIGQKYKDLLEYQWEDK